MTHPAPQRPRVLSIAGSDSGGGAGIQADIKTITALGGYAMTALTALTAQNTQGVQDILPVPPQFIRDQIRCVVDDLGVDAIKTGMLGGGVQTQAVAAEIARTRHNTPDLVVVVDPVMVAKGGAALLAEDALACLRTTLLPLATLITPNLPEAEKLTGLTIHTVEDMKAAAYGCTSRRGRRFCSKAGIWRGKRWWMCCWIGRERGSLWGSVLQPGTPMARAVRWPARWQQHWRRDSPCQMRSGSPASMCMMLLSRPPNLAGGRGHYGMPMPGTLQPGPEECWLPMGTPSVEQVVY